MTEETPQQKMDRQLGVVYKQLKERGFKNQRDVFKQGVAFGYQLKTEELNRVHAVVTNEDKEMIK